ncbi:MAG: hypothetical protein NC102_09810 [Clostridium sp.]|nr:hypothetical protein [Clostridium sp.]
MKKLLLILMALAVSVSVSAQTILANVANASEEAEPTTKADTKFNKFTSANGVFIKYADYEFSNFKLNTGGFINKYIIRVYTNLSTGEKTAFLRIRIGREDKIESIEYSDVVKILDAIPKLKALADSSAQEGNYMESKYVSEDGFNIGFYMEKEKITWFITVCGDKWSFKKDFDFEEAFVQVKNRMEELMK